MGKVNAPGANRTPDLRLRRPFTDFQNRLISGGSFASTWVYGPCGDSPHLSPFHPVSRGEPVPEPARRHPLRRHTILTLVAFAALLALIVLDSHRVWTSMAELRRSAAMREGEWYPNMLDGARWRSVALRGWGAR